MYRIISLRLKNKNVIANSSIISTHCHSIEELIHAMIIPKTKSDVYEIKNTHNQYPKLIQRTMMQNFADQDQRIDSSFGKSIDSC